MFDVLGRFIMDSGAKYSAIAGTSLQISTHSVVGANATVIAVVNRPRWSSGERWPDTSQVSIPSEYRKPNVDNSADNPTASSRTPYHNNGRRILSARMAAGSLPMNSPPNIASL